MTIESDFTVRLALFINFASIKVSSVMNIAISSAKSAPRVVVGLENMIMIFSDSSCNIPPQPAFEAVVEPSTESLTYPNKGGTKQKP
ncbi:hypothetical protein V6N13_061940 [Hibiscus sabdariffa]